MGGGTGFCTQGVVQSIPPQNVTLIDQSPHQLAKARRKPDLQGVTILEVRRMRPFELYGSLCIGTLCHNSGARAWPVARHNDEQSNTLSLLTGRRRGPALPYRQL